MRVAFRIPSAAIIRPASASQSRSLSTKSLAIVATNLPAVAKAGTTFTTHFYERMFKAHPELLDTFNVTNQRRGTQQAALFSAIARSATSLLSSGTLPQDMLERINHKHCALNVVPAQYDVVGEHILGTITDLLNPGEAVLNAWGDLYTALADQCVKREEEIYKDVESRPGGWRGVRKFVVTEKTVRSKHITSFTFEPTDGKHVADFSAGQYTTVWFQPKGWEHRQPRHYSLTNAPNGKSYSIAVKKEENGLVSSYLHDRVAVGDEVELSPPYGDFNIAGCEKLWTSDVDAPIVLMSAGVGITPMLSMLDTLKDNWPNWLHDNRRHVLWLHAAQNGREHGFRDYLVTMAKMHPDDITRRVWYSEANDDDVRGYLNTSPYHFDGLMNLKDVEELLPLGDASAQYFFCGPKTWMQSVNKQLGDFGVAKESLHYEAFGTGGAGL